MVSKKYHICFFPGMLNLGGVGSLTINLAQEFISQGHKVDLFLTKKKGDYLDRIPEGISIIEGQGSALTSIRGFANYLKKEQPDMVISARDYLNLVAIIAKLIVSSKAKLICSVHVDYSGMPKIKSSLKGIFQNFFLKNLNFYKFANNIVAVSHGVADDFSQRFNYPRLNIKVIYNPTYVAEKYLVEQCVENEEFFNSGKFVILSIGRLTEQKNFHLLIKAFSIVKKTLDCRLVILGEGNLRPDLEQLINNFKLSDDVLMPGFVDNPIDYMRFSDVFVMSSDYEGFGNVLVEALGAGLPVVSTDCPSGPAEILANGIYGTLVPIRDKERLAEAIIITLQEEKDKKFLIDRAKEFSSEKISAQYLQLISEKY